MQKKAVLYRMHTHDHLCPFGLKSRDLLRRQGFEIEDHLLTSDAETEAFKQQHEVDTTPQTFIDGQRIGGYDDLRRYFNVAKEKRETSYTPVIVIFAMAALIAIAFLLRPIQDTPVISGIESFIALSMCLLAVQKLKDLESFSLQFITYDLLAMRRPRYAYLYAFLEAFAGVGMLATLPAWLVSTPAILIGGIGSVSVFKAVYIDKRELKCACVGGDSKVPLGFVSLTENIMMVLMGVWMFIK